MRRWATILFGMAAKGSLLLCVAAVGLWIWSYSRAPNAEYEDLTSDVTLVVSRGKLCVLQELRPDPHVPNLYVAPRWTLTTGFVADLLEQVTPGFPDAHPPVAGVFVGHRLQGNVSASVVVIPMPFVVAVLAFLPLLAGTRHLRRRRWVRRIAAGCCIACGYDLRASPGRCPECGRITGAGGASTPLDIRP